MARYDVLIDYRTLASRPQGDLGVAPYREWDLPGGVPWTRFFRIDGEYVLRFPDIADFEIDRERRSVLCRPVPDADEGVCRHLFLNQVLPLAMSGRGELLFHGSAVAIGGAAVAILGETGRGKSTLAGALATSGHPFLTDDGLWLTPDASGWVIRPSHASIRLWPDSADALLHRGARAEPALPNTDKARFLADERLPFCDVPQRLRRVYFLGTGAKRLVIEPLPASAAAVAWLANAFMLDPDERPLLAAQFESVARIARALVCYRLDYPRSFDALPQVVRAIVEHQTT